MKCPKWQTENPQKNRFCRECGTELLLGCPQCGAEVLSHDKFCGKCGNKLDKALETEEKVPPARQCQASRNNYRLLATVAGRQGSCL